MHAVLTLTQAALESFKTEDGLGDLVNFFFITKPRSVLELVEIRITNEEV